MNSTSAARPTTGRDAHQHPPVQSQSSCGRASMHHRWLLVPRHFTPMVPTCKSPYSSTSGTLKVPAAGASHITGLGCQAGNAGRGNPPLRRAVPACRLPPWSPHLLPPTCTLATAGSGSPPSQTSPLNFTQSKRLADTSSATTANPRSCSRPQPNSLGPGGVPRAPADSWPGSALGAIPTPSNAG